MRVRVLGPVEAELDGRMIRLAGQRQRALLAALALDHGRVVPVDRLVDTLWDTNPPNRARSKIHSHVSALRQAFGQQAKDCSPLATATFGYILSRQDVELDLAEFESLTIRARWAAGHGQPDTASQSFGSALALWRGPAFADVSSLVIRAAAAALEDRRLLAVEAKAEADLALGRPDTVAAELSAGLAMNPCRERLRGLLMLAYYRLGCRTDALKLYRDGHRLMVAELGLEPGPELRQLHQRILAADSSLLGQVSAGPPACGPARAGHRSRESHRT